MTLFILLDIRTASSVTALNSQGCDMGAVTRVYIKTVGYCNIHDGWGQDNIKIMEWWRSVFRFGA